MQHTDQALAHNRLLGGLPPANFQRLSSHLELVSLQYGQVLHEPKESIQYVYFPYSCVISLLSVVNKQKAAEVAVIGNEGVLGAAAAAGIDTSYFRAVVQVPGIAARITAARMLKEFKTHHSWNPELLHFNDALLNHVAQTAVCNRFHKVEARLARWLLTTRDRAYSNRFYVTHAFLSQILGVRRVDVTTAATKLQEEGLISYSRGNIELINPGGLEVSACECYSVIKAMYSFIPAASEA